MTTPMKTLYDRLNEVGINKSWVKSTVLPIWWDDSIADNPTGYTEILMLLAEQLNISLPTLLDPTAPLQCKPLAPLRNKTRKGVEDDKLLWARCICTSAAKIAITATLASPKVMPSSAIQIRETVMQNRPCVDLEGLLEYCWDRGIPVIHASHLPIGVKKPDGMVINACGRNAVILTKKDHTAAFQLFVLAHELGHIACDHLEEGDFRMDSDDWQSKKDDEECQANNFAMKLLSGGIEPLFNKDTSFTIDQLVDAVASISNRRGIDPGYLVNHYAWVTGNWKQKSNVLKHIQPNEDGIELINTAMLAGINAEQLSSDNADFLMRICGINVEN